MKKAYRIIAIILLSLVLIIFILSFIAGSLVEAEARAYLKKHPVKGFNVQFDDIGVRLWSRTIKIQGINITSSADSVSDYEPGKEPESIQIELIRLSGISFFKMKILSYPGCTILSGRTWQMTHGG